MNYRNCLLCIWILFISLGSNAQEKKNDYTKWGAKLQYFGEFVLHPGLTVGTDYTISSNNWFNLHWDTELGGYIHNRNNNSVFLQSTLGTRFTSRFAVFTDIQVGMGYMLSMPDGDVYRVVGNGELILEGRPVSSHLKPKSLFYLDGMVSETWIFP